MGKVPHSRGGVTGHNSGNYDIPIHSPAKAGFVRASKANAVFHAPVSGHVRPVDGGGCLASEPDQYNAALKGAWPVLPPWVKHPIANEGSSN